MHEEIKRFHMNGETSDSNVIETKKRLIDFLESAMRDEGHVPVLDIEPQFTLDYDHVNDKWNFELSVYGVHVGRQQACEEAAGVMAGKIVKTYTQRVK